jgi:EF-P beta-lysylation protein EpmB
MIPATPHLRHPAPAAWQQALRDCVCDSRELAECLGLGEEWVEPAHRAAARFPLRVPRSFLARMRRGDATDPLLRQVLPLDAELSATPGYVADPVGDLAALAVPGLLHKYHGRALLVTTGACAIHCRYCFRREFPYGEQHAGRQAFAVALAAIRADTSITEVLLSGGDPLTLGDRRLAGLLEDLEAIAHVRRVRVHTRLPVVLPERIDDGFLAFWNAPRRLQRIMVIHANHAQELRDAADVRAALGALQASGTTLLNQSVLLRGVNDSLAALEDLSVALFESGVLPYYLHVLDPVLGGAHFDVPEAAARDLHSALTARLPGYLVPKLVREVAGAAAKTMLPPASR